MWYDSFAAKAVGLGILLYGGLTGLGNLLEDIGPVSQGVEYEVDVSRDFEELNALEREVSTYTPLRFGKTIF